MQQKMTLPFVVSLLAHAGLVALLALGVDFSSKPKAVAPQPSAPVVQAVVVDQAKVQQQVERIKQANAAKAEAERQRRAEEERKARAAQEKLKKLELERKRKEAEIKKAEEAAKQAKLKQKKEQEQARKLADQRKREEQAKAKAERERKAAEEKAKAEAAERKRKEDERKRKAEAERKRKEEERKRKAAEEAARKAREAELAEQLAAEQAQLEAARSKKVLSEVDRYTVLIRQTIQRNLRTDTSMRGKECRVNIRLAPDGFVISSKVLGGDTSLCRVTQAAINAAGKLPVSQEPDVYAKLKDINLTVQPEQ
ncbi:cell envelope integrity protein TolA [Ferrimonas sediminicola]|uniref:Cell envelope integrity protein TolA n=1 Tax=Ferrimonas sediminicola TaxID=2569538 RepID=A0A4U1BB77_9GAMM|nr:cell envelope integrity protein TolA [Ferrimonas sediminicola]TKB47819.1 cell envelope integrity protein TolA [Ferrimonas sediminicola]